MDEDDPIVPFVSRRAGIEDENNTDVTDRKPGEPSDHENQGQSTTSDDVIANTPSADTSGKGDEEDGDKIDQTTVEGTTEGDEEDGDKIDQATVEGTTEGDEEDGDKIDQATVEGTTEGDEKKEDRKRKFAESTSPSRGSDSDDESGVPFWPKWTKWEEKDDSTEGFVKPELPSVTSILADPRVEPRRQQALKSLYVVYRKVVSVTKKLDRLVSTSILDDALRPGSKVRADVVERFTTHVDCMSRIHKNAEIFELKPVGADESEGTRRARVRRFAAERRFRQAAGEAFVTSGCCDVMCRLVQDALYSLSRTSVTVHPKLGRVPRRTDAVQCGLVAMDTLVRFTSQSDVVRTAVLRHTVLDTQSLVRRLALWVNKHLDKSLVWFEDNLLQGCLTLLYNRSEDEDAINLMRSTNVHRLCRRLLPSHHTNIRVLAVFLLSSVLREEEVDTPLATLTSTCVHALLHACLGKLPPRCQHAVWDVDVVWKYRRNPHSRALLEKLRKDLAWPPQRRRRKTTRGGQEQLA